jgi:hypothetical protein
MLKNLFSFSYNHRRINFQEFIIIDGFSWQKVSRPSQNFFSIRQKLMDRQKDEAPWPTLNISRSQAVVFATPGQQQEIDKFSYGPAAHDLNFRFRMGQPEKMKEHFALPAK